MEVVNPEVWQWQDMSDDEEDEHKKRKREKKEKKHKHDKKHKKDKKRKRTEKEKILEMEKRIFDKKLRIRQPNASHWIPESLELVSPEYVFDFPFHCIIIIFIRDIPVQQLYFYDGRGDQNNLVYGSLYRYIITRFYASDEFHNPIELTFPNT
jgi:hypothetical protein